MGAFSMANRLPLCRKMLLPVCEFACPPSLIPSNYRLRSQLWRATHSPVCKIMDYGKFKYSAQKKAAEARKKQKVVEIKEIKLRPMIDDHDYDVKMRAMQRFFEEGDKVKVTLRYRGREMAHQEIGTKLLDKVKSDVAEIAKVEQDARFEGRQVVMVLAPR